MEEGTDGNITLGNMTLEVTGHESTMLPSRAYSPVNNILMGQTPF